MKRDTSPIVLHCEQLKINHQTLAVYNCRLIRSSLYTITLLISLSDLPDCNVFIYSGRGHNIFPLAFSPTLTLIEKILQDHFQMSKDHNAVDLIPILSVSV